MIISLMITSCVIDEGTATRRPTLTLPSLSRGETPLSREETPLSREETPLSREETPLSLPKLSLPPLLLRPSPSSALCARLVKSVVP